MIVLDTQGIVLRAVKYRDKDLILTIFTRKYGKVSAIAKGAQGQKSRFLSASQLNYKGSVGKTLKVHGYIIEALDIVSLVKGKHILLLS